MPDDDLEAQLREAMRRRAAHAPDPVNIAQRVLSATYGMPVRKTRPAWFLPVINAAVVVLVVAAVVGGVLLVRGGSTNKKFDGPAIGVTSTSPAPSGSVSAPSTSASAPSTSASPTVTASVGPAGGAVPAGFTPSSSTWISATQGLVLGTAPCSKAPCTSVVRTRDGGKTWQGIPAPVATLHPIAPFSQVTAIRFADAADGWAFGSELFATHDGGATWTKQALGSDGTATDVLALETGGGRAWAAIGNCAVNGDNCPNTVTVYSTPVGTDNWTAIGSPINARSGFYSAQLVTKGLDWWLNVGAIYHGVGTGAPTELATPCANGFGGPLAVADAQHLDVLCTGDGAGGSARHQLVGSTDGGARWSNSGPSIVGPSGVSGIADNANGVLLLGESSGASDISRTVDDGAHFATVLVPPNTGGLAWTDLGFTNAQQASVILNGTTMYLSRDAGATWSAAKF